MNWQSIVLTSVASGVVSALVSVIVVLLKQFYDRRIENQKAKLGRASWVHQRQVDSLSKIYRQLYEVQDLLRGATRSGRMANEAPPEEYLKVLVEKSAVAMSDYIDGKLLIPRDVADGCTAFFRLLQDAQIQLAIGKQSLLIGDGHANAERWREAAKIAHKEIPELLNRIENSAREIIHGEDAAGQV